MWRQIKKTCLKINSRKMLNQQSHKKYVQNSLCFQNSKWGPLTTPAVWCGEVKKLTEKNNSWFPDTGPPHVFKPVGSQSLCTFPVVWTSPAMTWNLYFNLRALPRPCRLVHSNLLHNSVQGCVIQISWLKWLPSGCNIWNRRGVDERTVLS